MRLDIAKRWRLVQLYHKHKLQFNEDRFARLQKLGEKEDIKISKLGLRNLIKKWQTHNSVNNISSIQKTRIRISQYKLAVLDRAVYRNREYTGRQLKNKYQIQTSVRSVQRYVKRLGE